MRDDRRTVSLIRRLIALWALQVRIVATWRPGRAALVRRALFSWLLGAGSLLLVDRFVSGFFVRDLGAAFLGALVIGLLNALVRPILVWLMLPFTVLTAGLVSLVINAAVVMLAAPIVPGLEVRDFVAAFLAVFGITIVQTVVAVFVTVSDDEGYYPTVIRRLLRDRATVSDSERTGLVIVQIDGLSAPILRSAIRSGLTPRIGDWIRSGEYRLVEWDCGLPSQTSAIQAGILHGRNDDIPAFRWYEKEAGRLLVSNRPRDAAEIERRLSDGHGLLRDGGVSLSNVLSGDAPTAELTVSRLEDPGRAIRPASFYSYLLSPYAFARALVLMAAEIVKEYYQWYRQRRLDVRPRVDRGGTYPFLRAVTNVLLRDLNAAFVVDAMYRGAPIIYVDFVDYDELAHHAGPERFEALRALEGLDRVIRSLERAAADAPRRYRFVVLSDHGQSQGATFRQRYGVTLEHHVAALMGGERSVVAATARSESWGRVNGFLTELTRGPGMRGRAAARSLRRRTRDGYVELGPPAGDEAAAPPPSGEARPELVVCASGNLGLVYFAATPGRLTLEEIEELYPGLVAGLVSHPGIGFVLVRSEARGPVVLGARGVRVLDDGSVDGEDPLAPFGPRAADHVHRLDGFRHVGDIVVNSLYDEALDEVAAFEELVGSHGGLGGPETRAFLLHPAEWAPAEPPPVGGPAVNRQLRRWIEELTPRETRPAR